MTKKKKRRVSQVVKYVQSYTILRTESHSFFNAGTHSASNACLKITIRTNKSDVSTAATFKATFTNL